MTRIWISSREVNKNLELLEAALNAAYAIESIQEGTPPTQLHEDLQRAKHLLLLLKQTISFMLTKPAKADPTLVTIIKELQKTLNLTPRQLHEKLDALCLELEKAPSSENLRSFLELLVEVIMVSTQKGVEELSALMTRAS